MGFEPAHLEAGHVRIFPGSTTTDEFEFNQQATDDRPEFSSRRSKTGRSSSIARKSKSYDNFGEPNLLDEDTTTTTTTTTTTPEPELPEVDFVPLAEPAFPPPSLYGAPEVTTEAPVQIVNRTFGYICEFTVFEELCVIDVECDVFGNELTNNTRWGSNLFPIHNNLLSPHTLLN